MSQILSFENHEYDISSLLTVQVNFEQLKFLITSLVKSQKQSNQRITDLEDKILHKEKRIDELEKQSNNQDIFLSSKYKNFYSHKNGFEQGGKDANDGNDVVTDTGKFREEIDKYQYQNIDRGGFHDDDALKKLTNKVSYLEKIVQDLEKNGLDPLNMKRKMEDFDSKINDNSLNIGNLNTNLDDLSKKNELIGKNMEEINIKIQDFNIYDLFKSNSSEGGSSDVSVILVQNLEKKVFKKFEFMDEKTKKQDEESYKLKNEISNVKNLLDSVSKNMVSMKQEYDIAFSDNNIILEGYKEKFDEIETKFDGFYSKIMENIESKEKAFRDIQENSHKLDNESQNNNIEDKSKISATISEADMKLVKDCNKKVSELEKNFKVFVNSLNIENIRNELAKLNEAVGNKINANEVYDMKDNMTQLNTQITFIKDSISQLLEDRKMIDDINWLRKKVENLSSSIISMKNNDESHNSSAVVNKVIPLDNSKYLESNVFTDFQKNYKIDQEAVKRITDELSRYIDDIITALKSKAGDKDMKNLEDYLTSKIEELKLNSHKKFADKLETSKNVKYLDAQVKHIIDVYIKKMEKGDNWLLAKKPVNGFACASCEAYIGDLHDNNQHVPWNKYPIRDPNDKAYRIGNGYSRMLQMLNVDIKKSSTTYNDQAGTENEQSGDEEFRASQSNMGKKNLILPHLRGTNPMTLNNSADNMKTDDEINNMGLIEENKNDNYKPKIVKIYKKVKQPVNQMVTDPNSSTGNFNK